MLRRLLQHSKRGAVVNVDSGLRNVLQILVIYAVGG